MAMQNVTYCVLTRALPAGRRLGTFFWQLGPWGVKNQIYMRDKSLVEGDKATLRRVGFKPHPFTCDVLGPTTA